MKFLLTFILLAFCSASSNGQVDVVLQNGHSKKISHVAISPNGQLLATSGGNFEMPEVILWDLKSGLVYRRLIAHTDDIEDISFSGNSFLVSCSEDKSIKVWNVFSGEIVRDIIPERGASMLYSYNMGKHILAAKYDKIYKINLQTGAITKTLANQGLQRDVAINSTGDYIFTTEDSVLVQIDRNGSRKRIHEFEHYCDKIEVNGKWLVACGPDEWILYNIEKQNIESRGAIDGWSPHSLDISSQSAVIGMRDSIVILDLKSLSKSKMIRDKKLTKDFKHTLLVPNKNELLILDAKNQIKRYELASQKFTQEITPKEMKLVESLIWDEEKMELWLAAHDQEGPIKLNIKNGQLSPTYQFKSYGADFTLGEKYGASMHRDDLHIWEKANPTKTVRIIKNVQDGFINKLEISKDGQYVYTSDTRDLIRKYEIHSGEMVFELEKSIASESTDFEISPNGKIMAISCSHDKVIRFVNCEDGSLLFEIKTGFAYSKLPPMPNADQFMINVKGARKINGNWYTQSTSSSNPSDIKFLDDNTLIFHDFFTLNKFDLNSKKIVKRTHWSDYMFGPIALNESSNTIAVSRYQEVFDYRKEQNLDQYSIELYNLETFEKKAVLKGHGAAVKDLTFNRKGKKLFSCSEDGTVRIWNCDDAKETWTISLQNASDFVIVTPSKYYYATRGAFRNIAFRKDKKVYPPESFELKYHRPDTVLQMMGCSDLRTLDAMKKAWTRRVSRTGYHPRMLSDDWHIPEMQLITKLEESVTTKNLTLAFEVEDSIYPIQQIQVYVNGSPEFEQSGLSIKKKGKSRVEVEVELNNGSNVISFECTNSKGARSIPYQSKVNYIGETVDSKLYILSFSVADYLNDEYDLKYPVKDARDLNELKWEKKFKSVEKDTLFDVRATQSEILKSLNEVSSASVDDVVIIFLSGHGLLDDDYEFYFATHDCDFDNPKYKGLAYRELEEALWKLKSRKVLLMMDACHSGEVDKELMLKTEEMPLDTIPFVSSQYRGAKVRKNPGIGLDNSIDFMKQLFVSMTYGSGAQVISAASGEGYALESDGWQNGVFTYAVLNGLKFRTADLDKNRKINVDELRRYISTEVVRLTNGQQQPTSRNENSIYSFDVY